MEKGCSKPPQSCSAFWPVSEHSVLQYSLASFLPEELAKPEPQRIAFCNDKGALWKRLVVLIWDRRLKEWHLDGAFVCEVWHASYPLQ